MTKILSNGKRNFAISYMAKSEKGLRFPISEKPESRLNVVVDASIKKTKYGVADFESQEIPDKKYRELLQKHHEITEVVRRLGETARRLPSDKSEWRLQEKDRERHEIHLELLREAKKFGKNDADVNTDLLLLEGSAKSLGVEIPIVDFSLYGQGMMQRIYFQRNPRYIAIIQLIKHIKHEQNWSDQGVRTLIKNFQQRITELVSEAKYFFKKSEGGQEKYGTPLGYLISAERIILEYFQGNKDERDITYLKDHLLDELIWISKQSYDSDQCLPDEVVLLYGVESYPEAYGSEDRPGEEFDYETIGHGELDESKRENTIMFSAHFAQRMKRLKEFLNDEPLVRGWAAGNLEGHNDARLYGVAVRKKFLPMIISKIRDNKDRYWGDETQKIGTSYVVDDSEGNWDWRNLENGELFDPFTTPEESSIPDMLVDDNMMQMKDRRDDISKEKAQARDKEIAHKESDRIWKIMNA